MELITWFLVLISRTLSGYFTRKFKLCKIAPRNQQLSARPYSPLRVCVYTSGSKEVVLRRAPGVSSYAREPARRSCYARGWAAVRVMPGCNLTTSPREWRGPVPLRPSVQAARHRQPVGSAPGASRKVAQGVPLLLTGPPSQGMSAELGRRGVPLGETTAALRPPRGGDVDPVAGHGRRRVLLFNR